MYQPLALKSITIPGAQPHRPLHGEERQKIAKDQIVCAYPSRRIIAMRKAARIDNGAGSSGSITAAAGARDAIRFSLISCLLTERHG
jgi:hypothetical protein